MATFDELIERLNDENLDGLEAEDMGVAFNLHDVVALLRLVRRELEWGQSLSDIEIPQQIRDEVLGVRFLQTIDTLLKEMSTYGPKTQNPSAKRDEFLHTAEGLRDIVMTRLRPLIRLDADEQVRNVDIALEETEKLGRSLQSRLNELESQQAALAESSAGSAAADLAKFYKKQAESHDATATSYLKLGVAAGLILVTLTGIFLFSWPPKATAGQTSQQWIEFVGSAVARLVVLSLVGFVVAFCVRNYRVNMHLEVLNKRRENALNTFGLMQAGVTSEDARNLVVGELVRAVFMSEETGFLGVSTDRTVIESPGGAGMLSAISAMGRQQTQ